MAVGDIIDAKEAAKLLGISVTAVHGLCSRGTLPSMWLGGRRVWKREQVQKLKDDKEYQKRRRTAVQLRLDGMQMTTDEAIRHMNSMKAQAPAGFDPVGKRRGEER